MEGLLLTSCDLNLKSTTAAFQIVAVENQLTVTALETKATQQKGAA